MGQDAAAAPCIGDRELTVLRVVLLDPFARSLAQFADCCGLSIGDTAAAATRLADLGLITWQKHAGWTDLRPRFAHASWEAVAARVEATPVRWPRSQLVPREPDDDRWDIDDFLRERLRHFRRRNPQRFDPNLEDDACLALSLLWMGDWQSLAANHLVEAVHVLEADAWRTAAGCFLRGSIRRTIGISLAESRALPGLPPMLVVDRQRVNCSVCGHPAVPAQGRHITKIDSQLGEGLAMMTIPPDRWKDEPFEPGCGVVWTHFTMRAWLAEVSELNGRSGRDRRQIEPLPHMDHLTWLDP
jgi:hypothetical protein